MRGSYILKLLANTLFEVWISVKRTEDFKAHWEIDKLSGGHEN